MAYKGICRIPGRTGLFEFEVKDCILSHLSPATSPPDSDQNIWLSPGLFDIQVNGMLGYNFSEEDLTVNHVEKINDELGKHGITRWCPTVITQKTDIVERNLGILREAIERNSASNIHCIHLEGHYISKEEGYRGIHIEKYIRDPDPEEFDLWQQKAGGHIGLFSLAPEKKGAIEFIKKLKKQGIKVALVHHNADHNTVLEAVAAGADLATHLVNGCAPIINRQHNILWSQLSIDELWASFIADGYHIPDYTLRAVIKSKGVDRSILITDLVHLSGLQDGEYSMNENIVVLKDGGLWVKGKGTDLLSGVVKTLELHCEYLATHSGFSIEQALLMASVNPARYFGIENQMGLFPGRKGPIIVFRWENNQLRIEDILK